MLMMGWEGGSALTPTAMQLALMKRIKRSLRATRVSRRRENGHLRGRYSLRYLSLRTDASVACSTLGFPVAGRIQVEQRHGFRRAPDIHGVCLESLDPQRSRLF